MFRLCAHPQSARAFLSASSPAILPSVGSIRLRLLSTDRPSIRQKPSPSSGSRTASSAVAIKPLLRPSSANFLSSHEHPTATANETEILVHWLDQTSKFHHIWLRDHCRCPECFHPVTKQRLVNTFEIPHNIRPHDIKAYDDGLRISWRFESQSHASFYPWSWLRTNRYDSSATQFDQNDKIALWGSEIAKKPPTVDYGAVMAKDGHGLHKWLSQINHYGFCFVSGVPPTPEATEELSTRIGFIRETHYGKFWDFTADLSRGDTAYSNIALGAHTDNTYFTDPCGLQLFHLLSHTEGSGGTTLLVDGFNAATMLKEKDPELFKILTTVPVAAHAAGEEESFYYAARPVLGLHEFTGELRSVRWNNDDRSVTQNIPSSLMLLWYDAIRAWNSLLTSPKSEYWVQLEPGTVIAIDNHRVLHGRSAFTGKRRMCGAYIGIDEFRSRLAVLSERFDSEMNEAASLAHVGPGRSVWSIGL